MSKRTPIVSSAHLAQPGAEGVSEFEYGLIVMSGAFERWTVRCMAAAGLSELSHLDVLVLHSVNHRDRDKRATDICFVLGIEDTHTVTYALKKLVKLELVERHKRGKESYFTTSASGQAACEKYRNVREACLLESLEALGLSETEFQDVGSRLRTLSGLYDQAARAAASL